MNANEATALVVNEDGRGSSSYQKSNGLDLNEDVQEEPSSSERIRVFKSFGERRRWKVIAAAAVVVLTAIVGWTAAGASSAAPPALDLDGLAKQGGTPEMDLTALTAGSDQEAGMVAETVPVLGGDPPFWSPYPSPYKTGYKDYSEWFSDEMYMELGSTYFPIQGIECSGRYCDNKRMIFMRWPRLFSNWDRPLYRGDWSETPWFSEENSERKCPPNTLVVSMECSGRYCDNVKLYCNKASPDNAWRVDTDDIIRTSSFSEEQGEGYCPKYYYLHGMECFGSYCDRISLTCAKVYFDQSNLPYSV